MRKKPLFPQPLLDDLEVLAVNGLKRIVFHGRTR
jgi:hypothetical protein